MHAQAVAQEDQRSARVAVLPKNEWIARVTEAGRLIPDNDALFDDSLALLPTLKLASSEIALTSQAPILALQEAALGTSTVSTQLGLLNDVLAEFLPILHLLEDNALDQLGRSLDRYEEAKSTFLRAVQVLRQHLTAWLSNAEIVAARIASLQRAAQAFHAAQTDYSAAIAELTVTLERFSARRGGSLYARPLHPIAGNVFAFFDRDKPEDEGYGLYTYMLFAGPSPRNTILLRALIESTSASSKNALSHTQYLNLFAIPTHSRMKAWRLVRRQPNDLEAFGNRPGDQTLYDYGFAADVSVRLCRRDSPPGPSICPLSKRGPYFLTIARRIQNLDPAMHPFLLVDLSDVDEQAFGEFVSALKQQVMRPDFTDRRKLETVRLSMISYILAAADVVRPVMDGLDSILKLSGVRRS